ncbi:hypothetical protein HN51_017447 [Arachis hypogaea]|uniref:AB hydrolase-1 domain-containing protein n=1 Tax=Arachis hypogaea TaxID=3818 RepID=A0A445CX50_ARAHY|nr:strigolactone esterase D14-like [Arachis ipaensis]XP_025657585.1 strigolactone esterase D14 [Arachis hypogaea]QHN88699.1 uncharacterized protein DS421_16g565650 [Arachis hypogaea]RYR55553.1 hypothetical protein Ahy_A06g030748 [Arachis hypogaea]
MRTSCDFGGGGIVNALNANMYGNGSQTLVLAHGYGTDQRVWHFLIPYLACYFKVLVFDLAFSPNVRPQVYNEKKYGSSYDGYAADLVCLLDELNLNDTIYLGHSMSAMIGCLAATKRPQLFKHLILLSGSPRYLNGEGYKGGFERSVLDTIFKSIKQDFPSWVHSFAPTAIGVKNDPSAVAEFEDSLLRMKPEVALSVAKTVFLSDLRWVLPHVFVPCTIIQSKQDPVVPKHIAFYLKRKLGNNGANNSSNKVKILKTIGHFPQLTAYPLLLKVLKGQFFV